MRPALALRPSIGALAVDRIEGDWVESKEITRLQADVALLQWQKVNSKGGVLVVCIFIFETIPPLMYLNTELPVKGRAETGKSVVVEMFISAGLFSWASALARPKTCRP